MSSVPEAVYEPNSFLILYLVPSMGLPFLCSSSSIRPVAFFPGKTLGGFHITLAENHRAILSPLSGYFDCDGRKGFLWPSADEQEVLRYRILPDTNGKRKVAFEFVGFPFDRENHLVLESGSPIPFQKEVPFLEQRHGVLYARSDFGAWYRMVGLKAHWPDRLYQNVSRGWRVVSLAYSSAHIRCESLRPATERRLMDPEIAAGDFPHIRTRGVPGQRHSVLEIPVFTKEHR
ncbi:MAG: hypothetical protein ACYCTV_04165 [Leptospirales bacterium]